MWPWPVNPKTVPLLGYPKVIPYNKFEHFGIIRFDVCCGQTDKQTDKQTDSKILPTPTDIVGVGNDDDNGEEAWVHVRVGRSAVETDGVNCYYGEQHAQRDRNEQTRHTRRAVASSSTPLICISDLYKCITYSRFKFTS